MVTSFGFDSLPYVGGAAVRYQLAERVFTTNESPPSEKIPFHHEMAQVPKFPTKLFFSCQVRVARVVLALVIDGHRDFNSRSSTSKATGTVHIFLETAFANMEYK